MPELMLAGWVLHAGTFQREHALLVGDDGRIAAVGAEEEVRAHPLAGGARERRLGSQALLPGTVSAHSHCFQVFLRGWADQPRSFTDWVTRYLYPLVERMDDTSLETAALLCFTNMVRAGITTVGEFHYLHNATGDRGHQDRGGELSRIVLRAARRVGLRVGFLRTIYDVAEKPGQARMAQAILPALDEVRALSAEFAADPAVNVAPAPHSLHGASREAIEASASLAAELDVRWHIHLAEQEDDVPYAQSKYGATPLMALERFGVLDRRTVLVHGIWLSPEERALLGERGGAVVSNPTTNMALGDGIADLPDLLRKGVTVGLGTDMNAKPNIFDEIRTAEYLQRVQSLKMGRIPGALGGDAPEPARLFELGTRGGAEALGLDTGALEVGRWADLLAIDLEDPSLLPASIQGGDALLNMLSSGMVPETAIRASWVGGQQILTDGTLANFPREELIARMRVVSGWRTSP